VVVFLVVALNLLRMSEGGGAPKPLDSMSGEIFGYNRLRSQCFQVQLATCCDLSGFLYWFEMYSMDSSKLVGNVGACKKE
jgi:hypothetical protein